MIEALIGGECDPRALAELARTQLRSKRTALAEALTGHFTEHHAHLARTMLDRINAIDADCAQLGEWIGEAIAPFQRQVDLLITIPGVQQRTAEVILAEIGPDPTCFPTAAHLAS